MSAELADTAALFRSLSHPARLHMLRLTWAEPLSGEKLALLTGLSPATVSHHLSALAEAGLVQARQDGPYRLYQVRRQSLGSSLEALVRGQVAPPRSADPYRERVLRSFIKDGRLTRIPAQRKKREVILRELVGLFERGVQYPEREVNRILSAWHGDVETLRREMIITGLMEREKGVYWRSEGESTP